MFDGKAFGREIVAAVKAHIDAETSALKVELAALKQELATLRQAPPEIIRAFVAEEVAKLPAPKDGCDGADGKSLAVEDLMPMVKELAALAVAALPPAAKGEPGRDGMDADPELVAALIVEEVARQVAAIKIPGPDIKAVADMIAAEVDKIPVPRDGKDADADMIVEAVLARMPRPKDGVGLAGAVIDREGTLVVTLSDGSTRPLGPVVGCSVSPEDVQAIVKAQVEALPMPRDGKDGAPGKDGRDADPEAVAGQVRALIEPDIESLRGAVAAAKALAAPELPDIEQIVATHVAKLPPAEKGEPGPRVTADEIRPLVEDAVKREVEAVKATIHIPPGLAKSFIDREGKLILSMSDGSTVDVGPVVGKDADIEAVKTLVAEAVAAMPKPKDGLDGLGFDDMDMLDTDEGVIIRFARGEAVKDFLLPIPIDRGVWKLGETYHQGAGVTYDGSFWISQDAENTDKPGKSKAWRMAVRKGKDRTDPVKLDD
jgi:hypothetical protein